MEFICLRLNVCFFRRRSSLLSQEIGEVNLDTSGWAWSQIVWLRLRFRFLEFEQLLFNHFHLLFLALHLDALLFLLSRGHVCFQQISVVSVSTENSLVVHDVESLTVILVFIKVAKRVVC